MRMKEKKNQNECPEKNQQKKRTNENGIQQRSTNKKKHTLFERIDLYFGIERTDKSIKTLAQ